MAEPKNQAELEKLLADCRNGKHNLQKIVEHGSEMESEVVRWCSTCGSIVVDTDYDYRTNPGEVMKMKGPFIFKATIRSD